MLELSSNLCHLIYLRNFFLSLRLNREELRTERVQGIWGSYCIFCCRYIVLSRNASSNRNVSFDFSPYIERARKTRRETDRKRESERRVCLPYVIWHMSSKYYATVRSLNVVKVVEKSIMKLWYPDTDMANSVSPNELMLRWWHINDDIHS